MDKNLNLLLKTGFSTVVLSTSLLFATADHDNPLSPISAEAATVTKYTTTANLNLRSTNSTKGKIYLTIPKGKEVTYIKQSGNWYQVKYNGKTGWVSATYIKKTTATTSSSSASTATTKKTVYTTTANLNLRSTNSTKGKIYLTIPKGKEVSYIKKSGNWYQVKYNGKTGWVSATYIKKTTATTSSSSASTATTKKTVYTTTANLNLRSTNSTKGKIYLTIPKGKEVSYIKKSGNWYQVKYNGKTGWVSASYIKVTTKNVTTNTSANKTTTTTSTANKTTTSTSTSTSKATTTTKYTTTANLNLRSTNSTSGKILLTIPKGKEVSYIKKSGNWYQVTYNGKTGWVSATYIKVTTSSTSTAPAASTSKPAPTTNTNTNTSTNQTISQIVLYTGANLNFRQSNSTSAALLGTIPKGTKLTATEKTTNGWYKVTYNGKTGYASGDYLIDQNTKNRIDNLEKNKNSYLFMDLRTESSVTAEQIDAYINNRVGSNRSVLKNTGKYFVAAGKKYGVNALYLAAHAIHESNFGKSNIALDRNNLFGYGAYDLVPYLGSVKFASIEQNIDFIAQKIKSSYLGNSYLNQGTYLGYSVKSVTGVRVDGFSKGMNFYYASDPAWGEGIAKHMNSILDYSKEGAKSKQPNTTIPASPSYPSGSDVFPAATLAVAKSQISLYSTKSKGTVVATIQKGETFNLLEKDNNYWLKVTYKGKTYYTNVAFNQYNSYFTVKNLGRVSADGSNVNIRQSATTSSNVLGVVKHKDYVELVIDNYQVPITQNGFYQVRVNGVVGWVSGLYIVRELNK